MTGQRRGCDRRDDDGAVTASHIAGVLGRALLATADGRDSPIFVVSGEALGVWEMLVKSDI
jgi:hypothetical protein